MSSLSCGTLRSTVSIVSHLFAYSFVASPAANAARRDRLTRTIHRHLALSVLQDETGSSARFWWFGGRVTPDPIPNSAVKPPSGDGISLTGGESSVAARTEHSKQNPPRSCAAVFCVILPSCLGRQNGDSSFCSSWARSSPPSPPSSASPRFIRRPPAPTACRIRASRASTAAGPVRISAPRSSRRRRWSSPTPFPRRTGTRRHRFVENKNAGASAKAVPYTVTLYGAGQSLDPEHLRHARAAARSPRCRSSFRTSPRARKP